MHARQSQILIIIRSYCNKKTLILNFILYVGIMSVAGLCCNRNPDAIATKAQKDFLKYKDKFVLLRDMISTDEIAYFIGKKYINEYYGHGGEWINSKKPSKKRYKEEEVLNICGISNTQYSKYLSLLSHIGAINIRKSEYDVSILMAMTGITLVDAKYISVIYSLSDISNESDEHHKVINIEKSWYIVIDS